MLHVKILKSLCTSFVAKQKFSKTIIAKHISMLVEVNPLTILLSSRDRFTFLKDY